MRALLINRFAKSFLLLLTFLCIVTTGCSDSPTKSSDNEGPLEGAWVLDKVVTPDYTEVFDHDLDNYASSLFIQFSGDKFYRYYNRETGYDKYNWDLTYQEDSFTITSLESSTLMYSLSGEMLVLDYTSPFGTATTEYYSAYHGKLLPDSWD